MMERCTASDSISVPSDSGSKVYTVSFSDPTAPTCDCVSFAIGRNKAKARINGKKYKHQGNCDAWCKHIDRVYDNACKWRGNTLIPGVCPTCGEATVPLDAPVVTRPASSINPLVSDDSTPTDSASIEALLREWTS